MRISIYKVTNAFLPLSVMFAVQPRLPYVSVDKAYKQKYVYTVTKWEKGQCGMNLRTKLITQSRVDE